MKIARIPKMVKICHFILAKDFKVNEWSLRDNSVRYNHHDIKNKYCNADRFFEEGYRELRPHV
jgi:hypothetical protein